MSFFDTALRRSTDSSLLKEHVYAACAQFHEEQGERTPEEHEIVEQFMESNMYYDPGSKRLNDAKLDIYYHVTFTPEGERLLARSMMPDLETDPVNEEDLIA